MQPCSSNLIVWRMDGWLFYLPLDLYAFFAGISGEYFQLFQSHLQFLTAVQQILIQSAIVEQFGSGAVAIVKLFQNAMQFDE